VPFDCCQIRLRLEYVYASWEYSWRSAKRLVVYV
jgi:hypothetical protein